MKRILLSILLIYITIGLLLYVGQRSFIYFPVQEIKTNLETRIFNIENHKIKVTVLNKHKDKAILYFGGNAENVDYNSGAFSNLFSGYTIYLVKYRGYGGSTGSPSEAAIYSDAIYIYDELINEHPSISVIGRSLGSGVATYLASKKDIEKLVLITPFDSIQSVAQSQYPIFPMQILLKDKHDSISRVKDIKADTLIIAAEIDRIIKMPHTKRLVQEFKSQVAFHVIEGVGHNDISDSPYYYPLLGRFLNDEEL
ncbi:MAG: alpha/beta hydrolase [Gammaproteobacteria bacterium]|nr:alpha/beta hydrolase [Gammaproteobacteria bacterium]